MTTEIQTGSLVQLNSGGLDMTVHNLSVKEDEPVALCFWFEQGSPGMFSLSGGGLSLQRQIFPLAMLKVVGNQNKPDPGGLGGLLKEFEERQRTTSQKIDPDAAIPMSDLNNSGNR